MPTKAFSQAKLLGTDNTISVTSLSADIPITEKFATTTQLPATGTIGEQAFVEETNRLYIWNGSGWYNIALINTTPNITSSHDSSYNLLYNTPLSISVNATDPEGINLTYDFSTSDSIGNIATITNDSSEFTITPSSNYAVEGTFGLVFRASDGVNIATAGTSTFTLANQAPSLSGNSASYVLSDDGSTATVITLASVDPEGQPITYSATGDSGFNSIATVAQGTGEAYAIASASILSGTHTVSPYVGGLTFKPDGTEMYYVSTNNDRVSRHTLSTAWDVSTASYVGSSPNTLTQVHNLTDVKFNNNGTKMYMADRYGTTNNTIYQYTLSTAWDINTASYDSKSYDFTSVLTGNNLNCFVFNADGTSVYLAEHSPNSNIFQYTLSTPFDISTASYANKSLSLTSVASNGYVGRQYFQFTNDGSKLFLIHTFHPAGFIGKIYEYSLTTAYDISTASHTSVTYTPTGITTGRAAIAFKPDGSKMFIMGTDNHTTISQFNLPVYNTNDFITTPKNSTQAPGGGTGSLTFTASDGIKSTNATSSFTLTFMGDWSSATQQAKIVASDAAAEDRFGQSVSISEDGNTAIVGAYYADPSTLNNAGAAYIYTRSGTTWSQQAKLVASNASAGDRFGISVDISGDGNTIVAGATYEDTNGVNAGAAYIYTRSGTTWSQQAMLKTSDAQAYDQFGNAVSISDDGNTAIIGAYLEDTSGNSAGSAYIFTRSGTTWSQQAKIQPSDIQADDRFGNAVSISGDGNTAIIGANQEDIDDASTTSNNGAAYIYTRSGTTWSQQAKIRSDDIQANDQFGNAVSISEDGNTAIVGAPYEDTPSTNYGAAYIFTRSGTTWSQQAKIQTSDSNSTINGNFGKAVSISNNGNVVVVGHEAYEQPTTIDEGAVHIFTRSGTTWTEQITLQASDRQDNDMLSANGAAAVSGDGETVIAGAAFEDTGGTDAGAAYIFIAG
jgi:hypothetical protein